MQLENAKVLDHREVQGGYRLLVFEAPGIAPQVKPGQFVHVQVPGLPDAVLRRPFSVFKTEGPALHLLYKDVGRGTRTLTRVPVGALVSLLGPLGHGFPAGTPGKTPVLVAGGYGMAALYLVARELPAKGVAFFGGRCAVDILCVKDFESLGWPVQVATEDGSLGMKGLVTDVLNRWAEGEGRERVPEYFCCGPNGMLKAVADRAIAQGHTAWLSMDRYMGCGVGACLTCVQKIRKPDGDWMWARICKEGPVFECRDVIWDGEG